MLKALYESTVENRLKQLRSKVDELADQASHAEAYLQVEYHQWVSHLRFKQERATIHYDELKNAKARQWGRFQESVENALFDLANSVDKTALRFSYR